MYENLKKRGNKTSGKKAPQGNGKRKIVEKSK